jgi:hypothetical protein
VACVVAVCCTDKRTVNSVRIHKAIATHPHHLRSAKSSKAIVGAFALRGVRSRHWVKSEAPCRAHKCRKREERSSSSGRSNAPGALLDIVISITHTGGCVGRVAGEQQSACLHAVVAAISLGAISLPARGMQTHHSKQPLNHQPI